MGIIIVIVIGIFVIGGILAYWYFWIFIPTVSDVDKQAIENCNNFLATDWDKGFLCVLNIGDKIESDNSCNKLNNLESAEGQLTDFQSFCKIKVAVSKKDESICSKITSFTDEETNGFRNTCIIEVAVAKEDQSLCFQMKSDEGDVGRGTVEFDLCLNTVAATKKDESICHDVEDGYIKSNCLESVALAKQDESICERIPNVDIKSLCYRQVAGIKNDWTICEKSNKRDNCMYFFGIGKRNKDACNQVRDISLRTQCLLSVLRNTKDESICNDLEQIGEMKKEACLEEIKLIE